MANTAPATYASASTEVQDPKQKKLGKQYPELYSTITTMLRGVEYDVNKRNEYIRTRYDATYEDGLYRDLEIDGWFAQYNLLHRVVDIHTTQLFGRGFNMVSTYSKEDLSVYQDGDQNKQAMQLKNKKLKADADLRMRAARAIIKDNGGMSIFENGGRVGSYAGTTVYKVYPDPESKKVVIKLLETVQNYRAGWNANDFRERDWDAYVYQISIDKAMREYGDLLGSNEAFDYSRNGYPFLDAFGGGTTTDPLNQNKSADKSPETERPMVTVIDATGYIPGYTVVNGEIQPCKRGKEKPLSILCVGGHAAEVITDEKSLPKYYVIQNRWKPRSAWGEADVTDSLIEINKEIVRLMADAMTWADKNLWKILMGKGLTQEAMTLLKGKPRKTRMIGMSPEQTIEEVQTNNQPLSEFSKLITQKLDMFMRLSGTGRVLFDDPSVNANSNQALMTTLKGVVDVVESKQKRWNPELIAMFTDALHMAAEFVPGLKEALNDDPDWEFLVEWPSVLRREDPAYQTMWLNFMNRGIVSAETFMQKALPVYDTEEELDRIRDEMEDPIMAALMGNQIGEVAHHTINKSLGIPPWGYVVPKVNLKGELAPQEVGNMAHNYQWDQGPYGPAIGPTGFQGSQANQDFLNSDFIKPPADGKQDGPQAQYQMPQGNPQQANPQQANPQLTPDQNQGQTTSQPGSGAPAVSPAGAVAQVAQNKGH